MENDAAEILVDLWCKVPEVEAVVKVVVCNDDSKS